MFININNFYSFFNISRFRINYPRFLHLKLKMFLNVTIMLYQYFYFNLYPSSQIDYKITIDKKYNIKIILYLIKYLKIKIPTNILFVA